jgi:hypothetical protein
MLRPSRAIVLMMLATACVSRTTTPVESAAITQGSPDEVQALVRLALTLDAAGDGRADTLYASDAVVVGNARLRLGAGAPLSRESRAAPAG